MSSAANDLPFQHASQDLQAAAEMILLDQQACIKPGQESLSTPRAGSLASKKPSAQLLTLPDLETSVVGVSGRPQAGKDVFADYILATYAGVTKINFSDPIIDEVNSWLLPQQRQITASNKSRPACRKLLQAWGRARRNENEQHWVDTVKGRVLSALQDYSLVIVAGVRALSDLELIEALGGVCIRVERPDNPYSAEDAIETALDDQVGRMLTLQNPQQGNLAAYHGNIEALLSGPLSAAAN
jgi:hypothetical protein